MATCRFYRRERFEAQLVLLVHALGLLSVVGCGRVGFSLSSSIGTDGGSPVGQDGAPDGGALVVDARSTVDASPPDGASQDAGVLDAGVSDAGVLDAGSVASPTAVVSTANDHTCVARDDDLWCFGRNRFGEVGLDPAVVTSTSTPSVVTGTWSTVSLGFGLSCGLDAAGTLACFGSATELVSSFVPTDVAHSQPVAALSTGDDFMCFVDVVGQVVCLGSDEQGRFGGATSGNPISVSEPAASVGVAFWHVCALTDSGNLHCWGRNAFGEVGTGTVGAIVPPTRVGTRRYRSVAVASGSDVPNSVSLYGATCAISVAGELFCWGYNGFNMLTDIAAAGGSVATPTRVGTRTDWEQVSLGSSHGCGIHSDGTLECWGSNFRGQLGVGMADRTDRVTPTPVVSTETWASVAAGSSHTCAVTVSNEVYCWGLADFGVLGQPGVPREVGEPRLVPLP